MQELQGEEEIRTLKRKANSTESKTNGCDSSGGDEARTLTGDGEELSGDDILMGKSG